MKFKPHENTVHVIYVDNFTNGKLEMYSDFKKTE